MWELGHSALAAGHELRFEEVLNSTNTEALRHAEQGGAGPVWFVAGHQTAGHGRQGRAWNSPPGNLYASLLLTDLPLDARTPLLGFVAAVALAESLENLAPALKPTLRLKWPNDLLANGAKLAGLLIESHSMGDKQALVLGCGVNCRAHPVDTPYAASSLAKLGADIPPEDVLCAFSDRLAQRLITWRAGEGFAEVRTAWLARAAGVGQPLTARLAQRSLQGVFETLDEDGRLILRDESGTAHALAYGEVFFGRSRF